MSSEEQVKDEAEIDPQKTPPRFPSTSVSKVPSDIALPSLITTLKSPRKSLATEVSHSNPPKIPPKYPSKSRSSARRYESASKRASDGGGGGAKPFRECVCGRGVACLGMTQAFRLLGDPRCYHVELPRYRKDPPAFKYVFRNNLRKAYLRQLVRQNPSNDKLKAELESSDSRIPKRRKYVALHHFHPTVVRAFYENPLTSAQKHKVPISITEHELGQLGMECYEEDRILSANGNPTGGYYFTPNYPHEKAHEDLKVLIQAVRSSRGKESRNRRQKKNKDPDVPTNIEITTPKNDNDNNRQTKSTDIEEGKDQDNDNIIGHSKYSVDRNGSDDINGLLDGGENDEEFNSIWEKSSGKEIESGLVYDTVIEEEEYTSKEESKDKIDAAPEIDDSFPVKSKRETLLSRRSADRPWGTPKYRRNRERSPVRVSGAADYIDPNNTGELNNKLASKTEILDDGEDIAKIAAGMTIVDAQRKDPLGTAVSSQASPQQGKRDPSFARFSPGRATYSPRRGGLNDVSYSPRRRFSNDGSYSPRRRFSNGDDEASLGSADSDIKNFTQLEHQLPGTDPTLRIQVHNDLIAWESKRRSDLAQKLEYNQERWKAACRILTEGIAEAQYAERLILGISTASRLFADALNAVYDDKLLDDKGNTVKYSFLRNRLAKQRNAVEYSIENSTDDSKEGAGLGSILLDSIVSAQQEIANAFIANSDHMEQEILPEITEFKGDVEKASARLQTIGDAVISELKQSEIEVKNIWGEFHFSLLFALSS